MSRAMMIGHMCNASLVSGYTALADDVPLPALRPVAPRQLCRFGVFELVGDRDGRRLNALILTAVAVEEICEASR
jgi:hypothetical protein